MNIFDRTFSWPLRMAIGVIGLLLSGITYGYSPVQAADDGISPDIAMAYYSTSNTSLVELAAGAVGDGRLLYFVQNGDQRALRLLVHLYREPGVSASIAEVYEVPDNLDPYAETLTLVPADAVIIMEALDGWWVKDNVASYNLNVGIRGAVFSMWGAEEWSTLLKPGEPAADIQVRDTDRDGVADWDLRRMIPEFPNRGYLRVNYAERKCSTPETTDRGVSPEWPYIALAGGFEQEPGRFRPPIVVDWERGKVTYFSELVTVRNQNCSYSFYSTTPIELGQLNHPNNETPFAFYDLSGEGVGYPNLILRTGRMIINTDAAASVSRQMEVIRYSWSNEDVGDGYTDYKVEVLGFHPYDFETPIADGKTLIDAPPYASYPSWVISRTWPVTTFIDVENLKYRTSEGIYEWAPGDLGAVFYLGYSDTADLETLTDIRVGLRGEYRLNSDRQSELYFSPIDNRLHLKWAEHGIWRLNEEQIIRVANLNNDETSDVWSREAVTMTVEDGNGTTPIENPAGLIDAAAEPETIETLYALDGYLLHSTGMRLILVASDYQPALFETLPPTDHATWEAHRARLAPYEAQRRDPADLKSWLAAFPGPRSEIAGAAIANLRIIGDGFRFELSLEPGYRSAGPDLLGLGDRSPGGYLIENHSGAFTVTPLIPARLSLDVRQFAGDSVTASVQVSIRNTGLADAPGLVMIAEAVDSDGASIELARTAVDALAGQPAQALVEIPSTIAAGTALRVRLEDSKGQVMIASDLSSLRGRDTLNRAAVFDIWQTPTLLPVLGLFAAFLALAVLLAVVRRRGQPIS